MSLFTDCKLSSHIRSTGKLEYNDVSRQSKVLSTGSPSDALGQLYTYNRENKDYVIASGMLNSLFKTHGYCVDPGARNPVSLTSDSIEKLKALATEYDDQILLGTINLVSKAKAPSPRMVNDTLMHETTLNEKKRFDHLTTSNRSQILILLKTILNIGMYLAGWKGNDEPYITVPRDIYDTVRVELKVFPLIQSLYINPNYLLVKNFPIMGYFQQTSISIHEGGLVKPFIVDTKLNVDHCLNQISLGVRSEICGGYELSSYLVVSQNQQINNTSLRQLASYLISTSYYYITSVCASPLPMVEPLIHNLAL